jgi:hypothetical protein
MGGAIGGHTHWKRAGMEYMERYQTHKTYGNHHMFDSVPFIPFQP